MYCNQCEETAGGTGCTRGGVCGKTQQTAELQDLLIYLMKGLAVRDLHAAKAGKGNPEAGRIIIDGLFETLTNVNFDEKFFMDKCRQVIALRNALPPAGSTEPDACTWTPKNDEDLKEKAREVGVLATKNEDVRSLRMTLVYGLKGLSAYYYHATVLGLTDPAVPAYVEDALASTLEDHTVEEMVASVLKCGEMGVKVLALLDAANTGAYGKPEITKVKTGVGKHPGILISGHDLKDLAMLLEQTQGTGVDVYTHGEMLPAHAYPYFKKYKNLVGNYGNSWHAQRDEFEKFNGPVLMTTNCLVPPKESYAGRVYTTGPVGYPGLVHIAAKPDGSKDFSAIIAQAKRSQPPVQLEDGEVITGCAHDAVLALAGTVAAAVKSGAIKKFVVMAGCDGRQPIRSYYTDFARALPRDTVILTAGCAKYRYNKLPLGDIGGIPRVLDAGQCNDCYSLVVIAQALSEAFGVGINELPLAFNIAWYEQKAVLVLLALLHLGIRDITLGPKLPAFVSPAVLDVLVKNFNIQPNTSVEADMKRMIG